MGPCHNYDTYFSLVFIPIPDHVPILILPEESRGNSQCLFSDDPLPNSSSFCSGRSHSHHHSHSRSEDKNRSRDKLKSPRSRKYRSSRLVHLCMCVLCVCVCSVYPYVYLW